MVGHRKILPRSYSSLQKKKKTPKGVILGYQTWDQKKSVTEKTEIVIKSTKNHKKTALLLPMVGTCILWLVVNGITNVTNVLI